MEHVIQAWVVRADLIVCAVGRLLAMAAPVLILAGIAKAPRR